MNELINPETSKKLSKSIVCKAAFYGGATGALLTLVAYLCAFVGNIQFALYFVYQPTSCLLSLLGFGQIPFQNSAWLQFLVFIILPLLGNSFLFYLAGLCVGILSLKLKNSSNSNGL